MKTLKRIYDNIIWIINHPPLTITQTYDPDLRCDYCGDTRGLFNYVGVFCICSRCSKKIADRVLKPYGDITGPYLTANKNVVK